MFIWARFRSSAFDVVACEKARIIIMAECPESNPGPARLRHVLHNYKLSIEYLKIIVFTIFLRSI